MKRIFISIDIPEDIKKEVIKIQKQIPTFDGKLTEPENLHLTLKFLGEIHMREVGKIKEKLKEINYKSFESEIGKIGLFDNTKSMKYSKRLIVWIHLKDCNGLQKKIDFALKRIFPEEERFMSHLTIARASNVGNKKIFLEKLNKIKIPKIEFKVDRFRLKESILGRDGPRYKTLEEYSLN